MQWRAYEMDVNSDKKRARKEGELCGKIQIYMQEMHLSVEEVAKKLSVDTETVEKLLAEMK